MKYIRMLLFILLCCSCDPMVSSLGFENTTKETIHSRMVFVDKNNLYLGDMTGHLVIPGNTKKNFGSMFDWEFAFEDNKQDEVKVVVFKDYNFLNDREEQSTRSKSDSLLRVGDYKYKSYKLDDLKESDWEFNYPGDGFKKGFPLTIETIEE